jgi:hypothetical protein
VLAADERNALAEARSMQFDERGAMAVLLGRHLLEHLGRVRIGIRQTVGIGAVDTGIVLFRGDGEREDLLLAEGIERSATEAEDTGKHEKNRLV